MSRSSWRTSGFALRHRGARRRQHEEDEDDQAPDLLQGWLFLQNKDIGDEESGDAEDPDPEKVARSSHVRRHLIMPRKIQWICVIHSYFRIIDLCEDVDALAPIP
jgi:hypothetical protein